MSLHCSKLETKGHYGPIVVTIDKLYDSNKSDLKVSIHSNSKVNLDNYIWQFEDKKSFTLRPWKAYDEKLLTTKQKKLDWDKNNWLPETLYLQFFSVMGCSFNLRVIFAEEA